MDGPLSARFHAAYDASQLSVTELWLRYFAIGGAASELEIDAYLNGVIALPAVQHDMLALAINERLAEISPPSAPYSKDFPPTDCVDEHRPDGAPGDPH
jgi:hypothetical protein